MMGKTHIFIGTALALSVTAPTTPRGCLPVILGGSLGAVLSDIDIRANQSHRDVSHTRFLTAGIMAVCLLLDSFFENSILSYIKMNDGAGFGALLFGVLVVVGSVQEHRGFTHSLLALLLFDLAVGLLCPPILPSFTVGFVSHLFLDSFNKKPVRLFFPLKTGICLKLFYADGLADRLCLLCGILGTIAYLAHAALYTVL